MGKFTSVSRICASGSELLKVPHVTTTTASSSNTASTSTINTTANTQVSYDNRRYEHILSNCVWKPEIVRTSTGFEPVTSRYRCDALTNWAMKPLSFVSSNEPVKNGCEVMYEMFHILNCGFEIK